MDRETMVYCKNNYFRYLIFLFRKRIKCILPICIIFTICIVIVCKFYSDFTDLSREEKLKTINELILSKSSRQACKHPYLPLNVPELNKFLKHVDPIKCNGPLEWVSVKESECVINELAKETYGDITCLFTDLIRINDFELEEGKSISSNDRYRLIKSDTVRVKCQSATGHRWHSVLIGIRDNEGITNSKSTFSQLGANILPVNVLMFGFDSLSRNAFMRKLPKTYEYLSKTLGAIVLEDYNIIGDGTPQALIPILTGKNELELPDTRKRVSHSHYVNSYPLIWNRFHENGYVSAFLEDTPSTGIFTYRLKGFKEPPTDHYMRPYYLAAEAVFKESSEWCAGKTPRHSVMMNFITQYVKKYKNAPKFLFGFHGELSHDDYNLIGGADDDTAHWLKELNELGVFNNTIFIFMSDHGNRFAEIRNTLQGKQEERLPFFSFVIPEWFKNKHRQAYNNLLTNVHRLSTPFDIHATFEHLLDWNNFGIGDTAQRSISLFKEIPRHRTCADAFIEPHWCACLEWKNVSVTTDMAFKVAMNVISTINNYTEEKRNMCSKLYLANIEWLQKLLPNDYLILFHKNHDLDGYIADFKARKSLKTGSAKDVYQIKLVVEPSRAIYEASISHFTKENRFEVKISDISRINQYGDQARCVYESSPHLRKYCYCNT